jgi:hypothetical protein
MNQHFRRNRLVGLCGAALLLAMGRPVALAGEQAKVLAKIGERVITLEEFQGQLSAIPESVRSRIMSPEGLRVYLNGMVLKELFAREALRLGLEKKPHVKARLEETKRQILYTAFSDKVLNEELKVDEKELTAYFEAHRGEFEGKRFSEVRVEVAQKVRTAKVKALWERTEQEARKRWGVTVNEALLKEVSIPKDQASKEKVIQDLERQVGPLPEETKRTLREENVQTIPLKKR